MSTYVIGDVQGCYDVLRRLLDALRFDPTHDRLWFAGDLVNRGPQSLEVLRFVRGLGNTAITVLGNHDLHLLSAALTGRRSKRDTLDAVLAAPDRDELLAWLRAQPLMHWDSSFGVLMVHAGLPPQWDLAQALACSEEVGQALADSNGDKFLAKSMYGDDPLIWDRALRGHERLRFIVNCCTRLRYCDREGMIDLKSKGAPGSQPVGMLPWFAVPQRMTRGIPVIFGHWSTLGRVAWPEHQVWGLDTGCVWGGSLTALRLEDRKLFSVLSPGYSEID
jgi:bis(5'-nucleosyl)-tetraphosphatase (symmetrical)